MPGKIALQPPKPARRCQPVWKLAITDRRSGHKLQQHTKEALRLIPKRTVIPGSAEISSAEEVPVDAQLVLAPLLHSGPAAFIGAVVFKEERQLLSRPKPDGNHMASVRGLILRGHPPNRSDRRTCAERLADDSFQGRQQNILASRRRGQSGYFVHCSSLIAAASWSW